MASVTQGAVDLLIWTIVFTILDILAISLRFLAAHLTKRRLYADDYLILLSWITTLALEGVLIWEIFRGGIGHFMTELGPEELQTALKAIPAAYVTWTVGTTAFKLSVLCLYVRIFSIQSFMILSYVLMGLTVAYCISFLVVFLTTCSPDISQLWNPRPEGYCRDLNIGQLGSVSTNLGLDILIIILPMPFLWKLQMSLRNKMMLSVVFSLGFITIGIMIWRIVDLVTQKGGDFVQQMPILALSTTLELWICIIIACIPTMAPILKVYVRPILTRLSGSLGSSSNSSKPDKPLRSIVTFGRLGRSGRKANMYSNMTSGSQDPIRDGLGANTAGYNLKFPEDAFTTTRVTANHVNIDRDENAAELGLLPLRDPSRNVIHVQQDVSLNTWQTSTTRNY